METLPQPVDIINSSQMMITEIDSDFLDQEIVTRIYSKRDMLLLEYSSWPKTHLEEVWYFPCGFMIPLIKDYSTELES